MLKLPRHCILFQSWSKNVILNRLSTFNKASESSTTDSMVRSNSSRSSERQNHREQSSIKSIKSIKSNKSSSLKSIDSHQYLRMKIHTLRALQDNFMYLLVDEQTKQAAAIDPVNASAMASAVSDHGVDLRAILTTHHHHDHAHGNSDMLSMFPEITVYGGDYRVQGVTKVVAHGEKIKIGSLDVECLATPCHTKGHICYYVTSEPSKSQKDGPQSQTGPEATERVVFTGDTLFIAGCGRFFEGSPDEMDHNLNIILGNLPSETRVYCGHEYTVTNLKFALTVEPRNLDIKNKLDWASSKVAKREPTVPSTIGEEKRINPFMRLKKPQVMKFAGETDELEVMAVLRQKKNEFVP